MLQDVRKVIKQKRNYLNINKGTKGATKLHNLKCQIKTTEKDTRKKIKSKMI